MFTKRLSNSFIKFVVLAVIISLLGIGQTNVSNAQDTVKMDRTDPKLVTFYTHDDDLALINADPQLAGSTVSVRWVDNTFLGLTDLSPETAQVRPEAATEWSSKDSVTWTFKLRKDIPWVSWNPDTQEAKVQRMVTAQDVVVGTRRACDARLGGSYGEVTASYIKGCSEALSAKDKVSKEQFEAIGVRAVDDNTVEFTLVSPTGFFPTVASLWTLRPVPGEQIDKFGPDWIKPGNAWFTGPFMTDTFTPGVGRTLIRNPFIPKDLRGPGNIDRVDLIVISEASTLLSQYLAGKVDMIRAGGIPDGDLPRVQNDASLKDQLLFVNGVGLDYLSFNHGKPPFDDVHVRRAFSAAIDRRQIIKDAAGGLGVPMIHMTPPSMNAAPPIDKIGVGYDPKWAVEELAKSPYPGCKGFPEVYSVSQTGRRTHYVEFLVKAWSNILGCDPKLFKNEEIKSFSDMVPIISTKNDMAKRPNWHPIGWGPDYPDANNYAGDILHCKIDNGYTSRPCSAVDDLITKAREEPDQAKRKQMYEQIEEMFFGRDGIYPTAPIRLSATYALYQTYLTGPFETDGQVGGEHWDWYKIDKSAQDAIRNKK